MRAWHFLGQFDTFLAEWQSFFFERMCRRVLCQSNDVGAFPRFTYREEPTEEMTTRVVTNLAGVALAAVLIAILTVHRLPWFSVAEERGAMTRK